jgi:predicted nucleic acid-binding protein
VILDAGVLISADRGEQSAREFLTAAARAGAELHTSEPVVAQVWRSSSRQARLAKFLTACTVHPFDDGRTVGRLLGRSGSSDVVDAHLVALAMELGDDILTGDPDDLAAVVEGLVVRRPTVHAWP